MLVRRLNRDKLIESVVRHLDKGLGWPEHCDTALFEAGFSQADINAWLRERAITLFSLPFALTSFAAIITSLYAAEKANETDTWCSTAAAFAPLVAQLTYQVWIAFQIKRKKYIAPWRTAIIASFSIFLGTFFIYIGLCVLLSRVVLPPEVDFLPMIVGSICWYYMYRKLSRRTLQRWQI